MINRTRLSHTVRSAPAQNLAQNLAQNPGLTLGLCLTLGMMLGLTLSPPLAAQQQEALLGEAIGAESAAEYYEKALVAYNLGEVRSSFIYLKNALKEDPLLLPAHLLLGKIYLSMGQGERAEKQLLIADGLGAHRSLIQNSLARSYLMQGKAQQLIDELFPVGTAPEEDAEVLALRGEAYLALEQFFDAQRSFTQAWEMNPRSVAAILGRVHVLLLQGELERARDLAREAVELAPEHARAWYLKGTLANGAGDYSGALADYGRAAEILPSYLPAQIGRITLLLRLKRAPEAAEVVSEIRALFPNDPRTHYVEAVVQTRLGNDEAAEVALNEAYNLIKRFPRELIDGHLPTVLMAGIVAFNLKHWDEAEEYLTQYLSAEPTATGPRVLLARIEMERNAQPEKAIRLLEAAVQRTPGNIQALSVLAEAYMRTNQHLLAGSAAARCQPTERERHLAANAARRKRVWIGGAQRGDRGIVIGVSFQTRSPHRRCDAGRDAAAGARVRGRDGECAQAHAAGAGQPVLHQSVRCGGVLRRSPGRGALGVRNGAGAGPGLLSGP